jgi:hypothetical protein
MRDPFGGDPFFAGFGRMDNMMTEMRSQMMGMMGGANQMRYWIRANLVHSMGAIGREGGNGHFVK